MMRGLKKSINLLRRKTILPCSTFGGRHLSDADPHLKDKLKFEVAKPCNLEVIKSTNL